MAFVVQVYSATFQWTSVCFIVGEHRQHRAAHALQLPPARCSWVFRGPILHTLGIPSHGVCKIGPLKCLLGFPHLQMFLLGTPQQGISWAQESHCCTLTLGMPLQVGKHGISPFGEMCPKSDSPEVHLCKQEKFAPSPHLQRSTLNVVLQPGTQLLPGGRGLTPQDNGWQLLCPVKLHLATSISNLKVASFISILV